MHLDSLKLEVVFSFFLKKHEDSGVGKDSSTEFSHELKAFARRGFIGGEK